MRSARHTSTNFLKGGFTQQKTKICFFFLHNFGHLLVPELRYLFSEAWPEYLQMPMHNPQRTLRSSNATVIRNSLNFI